jgi:hypothetical protein
MQLINSAVYDKEKQARAKAMEETRKFKEQRRAEREQTKVLRYAAAGAGATVSTIAQPAAAHQILVNDIPFKITHGGSKLVRVSGTRAFYDSCISGTGLPVLDDPNTANTTPKRVSVAGVTFVRSKNGNLHRLGAVASKKCVLDSINTRVYANRYRRTPTTVKKRAELCKRFTTTGILFSNGPRPAPPPLHFHVDTNLHSLFYRYMLQGAIVPIRPRPQQSSHLQGFPSDRPVQCRYEL